MGNWRPHWTHAVAFALGMGVTFAAYYGLAAYYVGRKYPPE